MQVVTRCQHAMSDLANCIRLVMIRDLGIGGQAHRIIVAAVNQGGFEKVSEPFELGERADVATSMQCFEGASRASYTPLKNICSML